MSERPILFSGPMVKALLDGRKTQTRRAVKGERPGQPLDWLNAGFDPTFVAAPENGLCPYGAPGDKLWVREAWTKVPASAYRMSVGVQQTVNPADTDWAAIYAAGWDRSIPKWKPSIHMPRWASRITLSITDVRVERLQDISEADALAEGLSPAPGGWWSGYQGAAAPDPVAAYAQLWTHINGPDSWAKNPFVWCVTFSVETDHV